MFEVYAWNPRDKKCSQYYYGGMLGNRNKFQTVEECQRSCHDAVLRMLVFYSLVFQHSTFLNFLGNQLDFSPTRRYSAVNRLYETVQIALNIEQVGSGFFKLIAQPSGKALAATRKDNTPSIEMQESNADETQQWEIIPNR